jgi:hypothetical protein
MIMQIERQSMAHLRIGAHGILEELFLDITLGQWHAKIAGVVAHVFLSPGLKAE